MAKRENKKINRYFAYLILVVFFFAAGYWLGYYNSVKLHPSIFEERVLPDHPIKSLEQEIENLHQILEEKELRLLLLQEAEHP